MLTTGFKQSPADPCVYIGGESSVTIVAVYVDDLIIIAETPEKMSHLKKTLSTRFKMKDMKKLHYCLGITIEQEQEGKVLWVHQQQYILKLIEKYGLLEAKTVTTPADPYVKLIKKDDGSNSIDSIFGGKLTVCCYSNSA